MLTLTLFLGGDVGWLREDEAVVLAASGFAVATVWSVWLSAIYPMLAAILFTEMARARSFLVHLVCGGLVAVAAVIIGGGMDVIVIALDGAYKSSEIWLSVLSGGFVGGLVHWLIAGHRAGKWLGEDPL
ncbi:MAG: hypothetical protein AAFO98_04905 [Pseudomonadota bacterium]